MVDDPNEIDTLEEALYSRGWLMGLIVVLLAVVVLVFVFLWAFGVISTAMISGLFTGGIIAQGAGAAIKHARD